MELREQILKHRSDDRFIAGGLLFLLIVFSLFYYLLQRGKGLSAVVATDKLLLFVLWYFNITLVLSIIFILVRNLFRLLLERHNRILGSKFKTKLVASAIALSLIPVLILFPFATRILIDSFEQWFSLPIEEVLNQAKDTADALSLQIEGTNLRDARRVLEEVAEIDLEDLRQRPELQLRLQELRDELQLHYLALYDGREYIHGTADVLAGFRSAPKLRRTGNFLGEVIDKGEAIRVEDTLEVDGRLILAAVARQREGPPAAETAGGEGVDRHTVVVAGTVLPPDIAEQSAGLLQAYQKYLQLSVGKERIQTFYLLLLLMVTLLVVLAFSSIGMRLARRITEPIQALAEATTHISRGDLDHRVEVAVDDELGVLVDGFNHMTEELQANRELVDRRNRELVDAHKRIAAVLQSVAAGVIAIDANGRILTCNRAALEILHQGEDVIGRAIHEAWADGERGKLVVLLEEDFTSGGLIDRQLRMIIGGVWKTLEVKVKNLPGAGGMPGGRVVVLEDLTELIYAQKMATWNEVARRIAHEIKNPLTPIRLTAERLLHRHRQGDPELGKTLERGVETIVREVSTLKSMVDEFSRFARMPRPRPEEIDLRQLAGEMLGLYRDLKPGVEVESSIDPDASRVRFDPEQLKSVLINLLDNAIEATEAPGQVMLSSSRHNGLVFLNVADTGRGVPAEEKEKLFLPYYSTKGRGTGLGLSIVHRIVTDHNAAISIADNQPRGAVFTLEIPLQ